ncbi:MAG: hypothetical protein ABIR59_06220 [Gemmatimonadales bacterium]
MPDRPTDGGSVPDDRNANLEAALGGADSVQKTTYVSGQGTDPDGSASELPSAVRAPASAGPNTTWIIIAFLLVAAVLVYLLGFIR